MISPKLSSTCNYYSILNKDDIAASVIIMNEKIDDGPIILRKFKVNFEKRFIDYIMILL